MLALAGAAMLALRLCAVFGAAEPDGDAYGHLHIARALADDPANLRAHWVWLPGWHYALAGWVALGGTHTGVRLAVALLQTLAPFVLHAWIARRDERVAQLAALAFTLAPLPNVLGVSAQPEAPFAWLLLGATVALARGRGVLAGVLLALASLVRYEAWGAVGCLVAWALVARLRRRPGPPLVAGLVPLGAIVLWIALRRVGDGSWLWFVAHTRDFAGGIRDASPLPGWVDTWLLPLWIAWRAFGPSVVLVPLGLARALRALRAVPVPWLVPGGAFLFLTAGYLGGGVLALPRYLTAFTPFACVAMAEAALALGRSGRRAQLVAAGGLLVALGAMTAFWYARLDWG
ncbi:MAG: hypothetical protein IT373_20760 [Polyangiaceae bacterium]|nr:hypothetical protein [Polyangiaceae bacterium]